MCCEVTNCRVAPAPVQVSSQHSRQPAAPAHRAALSALSAPIIVPATSLAVDCSCSAVGQYLYFCTSKSSKMSTCGITIRARRLRASIYKLHSRQLLEHRESPQRGGYILRSKELIHHRRPRASVPRSVRIATKSSSLSPHPPTLLPLPPSPLSHHPN